MDSSQEAANRAQVKSYYVTLITLIITVIMAIAPYFVIWLNGRGTVMLTGWLPIILLLCSSAVSATASIIVSARLLKTKRLTEELDNIKSDLSEANTNSQRLKNELDAKTQTALALLEEKGKLERQLAPPPDPPKPSPAPKPQLTFEIDEREISQVRVGNGNLEICRIHLELKLRCVKESDSIIAVRSFHASLHHLQEDGSERIIINQEDVQCSRKLLSREPLSADEMWTIREPDSGFRIYEFVLQISRRLQASLSPEHHFLRVTMNATGQEPFVRDVFVEDWTQPGSRISVTRPERLSLATQTKINTLRRRLNSADQKIQDLGQYYQQFESLIALAKKHSDAIADYVIVTDCERGDLTLQPRDLTSHPKVMLSVWITNKSILEVAISNKLDGVIEFEGTELRESKKIVNPITSLETGDRQCLTIEQRLSDSDVSMLMRAQHSTRPLYFNFDRLILNIICGKRSSGITVTELKIEEHHKALAFPVNPLVRLQRVRVLCEIRGACFELHELLRIAEDQAQPLPIKQIESWRERSLETLKKIYNDAGAEHLWIEITHGEPIPENASFQRDWLSGCLI